MPVHLLSVLQWQQLPWESGYLPTNRNGSVECKVMPQCTQKESLLACDNELTKNSEKMSPDRIHV